MIPDYYKLLQLRRDADRHEIQKAIKRAMLLYHPDRNKGSREAERCFIELMEARDLLLNPSKRLRYNDLLNRQEMRNQGYRTRPRATYAEPVLDLKEVLLSSAVVAGTLWGLYQVLKRVSGR